MESQTTKDENRWTTVEFRHRDPDSIWERDQAFTLEANSGNQKFINCFSRSEAQKLLTDLKHLLED